MILAPRQVNRAIGALSNIIHGTGLLTPELFKVPTKFDTEPLMAAATHHHHYHPRTGRSY